MEKESEDKVAESSSSTIRLLLHAVDGLVPYLTPQLLRTCFPAKTTRDRLWMGLAVKDTCVVPSFASEAVSKNKNHPRGYEYTANHVTVDAWMQPYTRVTVPTFDMIADAQGRQHAKDAAVVAATEEHVMLWTGNGRQPITAAQYFASAQQGLQSAYTVPLFDAGGVAPVKHKRIIAAQKRTQKWSRDYQERSAGTSGGTLFPILVGADIGATGVEDQLAFLLETNKDIGNNDQMGAVLIGWSDLSDELQISTLERVQNRLKGAPVGMLATNTLAHILRAACHGATIIGSNLPQQWALQKKAFLFDLEECLNTTSSGDSEPPSKRLKTNETTSARATDTDSCLDLHAPGDRVEDHSWYRDKRPLMPDCTCHTCRVHSRAYLYHLVCAKELLAEVLLFIHNLHHLLHVLCSIEKINKDSAKQSSLLAYVSSLSKATPRAST